MNRSVAPAAPAAQPSEGTTPARWHGATVPVVISVLVFALVLFACDRLLGSLLENAFLSIDAGEDGNTTNTLLHSSADIEIFGDSRASHHYDPPIFEAILGDGTSCHNASRTAQGIVYTEAVQRALLARHRPKLIILELNPVCILASPDTTMRLSALLPYYHIEPAVRQAVESRSRLEEYKLLSRTYPFNSKLPTLFKGYLRDSDSGLKGFRPLHANADAPALLFDGNIPQREQLPELVDPDFVMALRKFVQRANKSQVPLILICSPIYSFAFERQARELVLEQLKGLEFEFWDYLDDPRFHGRAEKFHDRSHLNAIGAAEYSRLIAERLLEARNPDDTLTTSTVRD